MDSDGGIIVRELCATRTCDCPPLKASVDALVIEVAKVVSTQKSFDPSAVDSRGLFITVLVQRPVLGPVEAATGVEALDVRKEMGRAI